MANMNSQITAATSVERGRRGTDEATPSVGFGAVASLNARVLVLGSLPGRVSLRMRQYYAQPRNSFWRLMGRQFNFRDDLGYQSRLIALKKSRVALWDVCASAHRPGSLDASIDIASVRPNDFAAFFAKYDQIHTVFFNGSKSAALYRQLVLPKLPATLRSLGYVALPSTSPAHAAMTYAEKLKRWSSVRLALES
jgi:double-stranded uracil-DNA glycosylase